MKKLCLFFVVCFMAISVVGCTEFKMDELVSETDVTSSPEPTAEPTEEPVVDTSEISEDEMDEVFTSPDDFKERTITLVGQVFGEIEKSDGCTYFQMYADPENREHNTTVAIQDDIKIKADEYVKLTGTVIGNADGENAFGGVVSSLGVVASSYKKLSYAEVISPSLKTLTINKTFSKYGHKVKIKKIEFAEAETRVYVKVINDGNDTFQLYPYSSVIIQNKKQFEEQTNFDAKYPEIDDEQKKGTESSGILVFEPMNKNKSLEIHLAWGSYNYEEDTDDFIISVK